MAYYDRYRGSRRRKRNRIKIILLILLLLVVIAVAALFFLQDAVIFTADGFHFPFTREDPKKDPVDLPGDVQLEIEEPQPDTTKPDPQAPTQPETPQPQPEPQPEAPAPIRALLVSGSSLLTDREMLLRQIEDGGHSQLALRIKAADGISLLDDGIHAAGISDDAPAFAQALEELEIPRIAVLSALRDNVRPRTAFRSSALKLASGSTWLDREYVGWFDPTGKDTLSALTKQLEACEAAGFTQVVLENFHYPTAGKLELIDYGENTIRRQALTQLASQLRQVTDLELGLVLTEAAAENLLDDVSGQDVVELAQYFDVLYLPAGNIATVESATEGTDCQVALLLNGTAEPPTDNTAAYLLQP